MQCCIRHTCIALDLNNIIFRRVYRETALHHSSLALTGNIISICRQKVALIGGIFYFGPQNAGLWPR